MEMEFRWKKDGKFLGLQFVDRGGLSASARLLWPPSNLSRRQCGPPGRQVVEFYKHYAPHQNRRHAGVLWNWRAPPVSCAANSTALPPASSADFATTPARERSAICCALHPPTYSGRLS